MIVNPINPFEYVSILISLILGLGITQLLSSLTDLLYQYNKVKFYWPHSIWIGFILFLHIQDWFITFQLKDKLVWNLPELVFVLLYPITLFAVAKLLLPTNDREEKHNMKSFYQNQFQVIFFIVSMSILISIIFNLLLLKNSLNEQIPLILFFTVMILFSVRKIENEILHKVLAIFVFAGSLSSVLIERNVWVIK